MEDLNRAHEFATKARRGPPRAAGGRRLRALQSHGAALAGLEWRNRACCLRVLPPAVAGPAGLAGHCACAHSV